MSEQYYSLAIKVAKSIGFMYCLWLTLLFFMQNTMIFPTYAIPNLSNTYVPRGVERDYINTEDGFKVEYWYIKSSSTDRNPPTIVVFHGNASAIDYTYPWITPLKQMGFNILIPEFRGYGRSTGTPSQSNIKSDMQSIIEKVAKKPEVNLQRLVYLGESLGGAIAFDLVGFAKPIGMVMRSTFLSGDAMALRYLVPSFLMKNHFRSDEVLADFEGPIFIAHGRKDSIIPFSHAEALRDLAKYPTFYPVNSDHNDFPLDRTFWESLHGFFLENGILEH
jgi:fermentation-respiration switch protein FrsA (DUF1100 family)